MASNSEHHQVPVIGQSGHWGQYQIPRAPPGLAHMQAHPPALPIPVLGNLQAHPAVQPMETAEHGVQHPGYNYQPIPAIVTSGRQHDTEGESEAEGGRDLRSYSIGRPGQQMRPGHHEDWPEQGHYNQDGRRQMADRHGRPQYWDNGHPRQRSSSTYSGHYSPDEFPTC